MPLRRPTRVSLAPRNLVVALVFTLCAALLLAAAAPASAVTRKQAAKNALAALGSKNGSDPVVVFGLTNPVRAGTRVTKTGGTKTVGKAGNGGAFFFYEDSGPGEAYPHAGRVALVNAKSGKVKLSRTINRAPRVNGKLPAFLTTSKRYRSSKYRVFARSASAPSGPLFASDPFGPAATFTHANQHPKAHDQTVTAKQNVPKNITLVGTDPDDEPLTFAITDPPNHGTLSGAPPNVVYTPDFNYLGKDKFAFDAIDGANDSNTAHVTIHVKPLGIPPTVTTSAGCTAYTEQTPAVAIDGSLTVSDPDDTVLDHATVRIPIDPGEGDEVPSGSQDGDEFLFTDQNGITGSYDDLTGTLTLSGEATKANYQTALRSVRYRNLNANPPPTRDVEFVVNDAGSDSAVAIKQICISGGGAGDNNKPIGEASEGVLDYIENDGPLPVDGGFFVTDADSAELSGATIRFTESQPPEDEEGNPIGDPVNNFAPDEDELAYPFDEESPITGVYDDVNGIMTLSGTATVEQYQTAIRSVTYENVSEDPSDAPRTIRFQVTDSGGLNSVPSNRAILVTPVNDAPVVTTTEGSGSGTGSDPIVVVDSGLTTLDVDDDDLESARVTISSGSEPGDELALDEGSIASGISVDFDSGVLTLTGTASVADYQEALRLVEYRHPGGNPGGTKTIEFIVNDGDLDSAPATKNIEVNDAPVLDTSDSALSYTENDGAVAADSGITATDPDSADLVGATVQITTGYTEGEDFLALAEQNGITGEFNAGSGTLTLSGTATVAQYQAALGDVRYENTSENPSDATRTLTFQADDGGSTNNLSDPVTRDIEVTPVNDAPVLDTSDSALSYTENDGAVAADNGITATDVDSDTLVGATVQITGNYTPGEDFLSLEEQAGISGSFDSDSGTLTLTGTATVAEYQAALGDVRYQNPSENPSDATRTLTFQADDGGSTDNLSAPVTRDIEVTPVNDAPVVTTSEDSTIYFVGDTDGVEVDADVTVTDADDEDIESAVVRISSGFEAGDELTFVAPDGVEGGYNTETGVLTLTGPASVESYQTALASIKYSYTGESQSGSRIVEFVVNDGDDDSNAALKTVDLLSDQPPEVTTSEGNSTYTLGDTAGVEVDSGLTVTDADDENLESAYVQIQGFEPGDELMFTDQNGIFGVVGETGDLTLTGSATLADYQTALRSVRFRHSGDNQSSSRSVAFKVNDGDLDSTFAFKTIDLVDPPPP